MELPAELRDGIVWRHRSGEGYKKNAALRFQWPPSFLNGRSLEQPGFYIELPGQTEQSGEKDLSKIGDQEPDGQSG